MSVNSSSSSNSSLPSSSLSSFINIYSFIHKCMSSKAAVYSTTAFTITSIPILLPLCFFVLYLGFQRWRQQRSTMSISHSDVFTYHMVFAELLSLFGSMLICCGIHTDLPQMIVLGVYLCYMNLCGQMYFHVLTCVERYLAVVHPVTYLSLRKEKGIRIRNISIGCVWLLCFAMTGATSMVDQVLLNILSFCLITFTLLVVSFCSLSVLCVLIRPGPGEEVGDRQRVDQSKLRAFYTIMAILVVLLFRVGGSMLATGVYSSPQLGNDVKCGMLLSRFWLCLPSSLVLPLLFLQRAGKLPCCKNNNESGQGSD